MDQDYSAKIKKYRNLALFKDKTDEEIIEWIKVKESKQRVESGPDNEAPVPIRPRRDKSKESDLDAEYETEFNTKLAYLQKEYGVDMNNSNDAEMLKSLVEHSIQKDIVNRQIVRLQREEELDTRTLKNLGDYQKGLITTISDLQEKLGINRKQRKEKQVDSIPQFIELARTRAREVWNRSTHPIKCGACEIELARFWLNFPDKAHLVHMELECWKCGERVVYDK